MADKLMKLVEQGGGTAFPFRVELDDGSSLNCPGMSLRDYFAAQAIGGLISNFPNNQGVYKDVASHAYRVADEMLKVRDNG